MLIFSEPISKSNRYRSGISKSDCTRDTYRYATHEAYRNSDMRFNRLSSVMCSCPPAAVMPARRSACALSVAIAAGSSVRCLPRSVTSVLLSRGAAGGEIRALAALVIPPRWCASLLARFRQASGVSSRAFCRLLPANTTSQSMRPSVLPLGTRYTSLPATSSIRRL